MLRPRSLEDERQQPTRRGDGPLRRLPRERVHGQQQHVHVGVGEVGTQVAGVLRSPDEIRHLLIGASARRLEVQRPGVAGDQGGAEPSASSLHRGHSGEQPHQAPRSLSAVEAVSLLAGGTTAITALRDHARLKPGERLLVRGASGGVGSLAVQIGRLFGAHVTGLAGARSLDFVRSLGADESLDYRTTTPEELERFDVVVDIVGTEHRRYRRLLTRAGRMVAIGLDVSRLPASVGYLAASMVHGTKRVRFFRGEPGSDLFAELTRLVEHGDLSPVVDTVHPLEGIAEAHRALDVGGVHGKHVIRML